MSSSLQPYYDHAGITLYHGDCREVLFSLAAGSVDAALTDPPYNVGIDYGTHDDRQSPEAYRRWLAEVLSGMRHVVTDGVVFFPGQVNIMQVGQVLDAAGLRFVRQLGWHRTEFAGDRWIGGPARSWEPVVWASKQDKAFFNRIYGRWGRDFLVVPATHGDPFHRVHPCPKPLPVMRWLVGLFVPEQGSVLDPFAGTGTTLAAAKELGRRAIGIEIEERYCEVAARRLSQEVMAL